MLWTLRVSGLLLLLVTVLPLIPTGKWYVRWWDFPRLQIVCLLAIPIAIAIFQLSRPDHWREATAWLMLTLAAAGWQVSHIIPFSRVWPVEVEAAHPDVPLQRLVVANLDYQNSVQAETVQEELASEQAEILLLIETDKEWESRLGNLFDEYPYRHCEIRDKGLGMCLLSKIRIVSSETRYLISDRRPSIWARLQTEDGDFLNFVGVHPTPPGLLDATGDSRRDSRVRDAELIVVAKEIASRADEDWIVAGDFNDVAWSHTTRLFKRTSGLKDPRIGRSFMGTYIAQIPPCRCPIDHVFLSRGFELGALSRKWITGSDHFAVIATFGLTSNDAGVDPDQEGDDPQDAQKMVAEGIEDAQQRDVR